MRALLPKLGLLLVSLVVGLVAAEVLLRLLGPEMTLSSEWVLEAPDRVLDEDVILVDPRLRSDAFYAPFADGEEAQLD